MTEHKLGLENCPACQDDSSLADHLFAQVARLEAQNEAMAAVWTGLNIAHEVRTGLDGLVCRSDCPRCAGDAALSDAGKGKPKCKSVHEWRSTEPGTPCIRCGHPYGEMEEWPARRPRQVGKGWLEVREQVEEALEGLLRDMHTGTSSSNRGSFHHDGLGCGRPCDTCNKARVALDALKETK